MRDLSKGATTCRVHGDSKLADQWAEVLKKVMAGKRFVPKPMAQMTMPPKPVAQKPAKDIAEIVYPKNSMRD